MMEQPRKLDVVPFNRLCSIIGLAFLCISLTAKVAWYEHKNFGQMQDFPQYYMGGVIARHAAWDALYPIPRNSNIYNAGFPEGSELRPEYAALAKEVGVAESENRFIQPPPFALLMLPFAFLPLKLSFYVWTAMLIFAAWGIGRHAAEIIELCLGRQSRISGLLVLLVCFSPQAHRWVRVENLSVLIGWLIGFTTLELVRRDSPRAALAMTLGTLAKYALLVLLPLQIAMRRWRTIGWDIGLGIIVMAISLAVMKTGPFRVFFSDIAPTLGRASIVGENASIQAFVVRMQGLPAGETLARGPMLFLNILRAGALLLILVLIFRRCSTLSRDRSRVFAAAAALLAWLLLFSPIFWEHYHAYLAPFWGWLAYEATRSRTRAILATAVVMMEYVPFTIVFRQLGFARPPEPLFSHLMWSTMLMLAIAIARLIERDRHRDELPSVAGDSSS